MKQTQTRTWAEVNLANLEHNYRALRAMLAPGCRFLGVVKANAYGHGAVQVAQRLDLAKVKALVRTLPRKERLVIEMRYGLLDGAAHPQHEVAALLGISRSYVSRLEKKALALLREGMEKPV